MTNLGHIMNKQKSRRLPLKDAKEIVRNVVGNSSDEFFFGLEDESLVTTIEIGDEGHVPEPEYLTRFTFERIGDFVIAENLISSTRNLVDSLKIGNSLNYLVANEHIIKENSGIIEALSLKWVEEIGCELIDCVEPEKKSELISHFIFSLYWRRTECIKERTIELVYELLKDKQYSAQIFSALFELSTREHHPLNANFLHNYLIQFKMVDRDEFWTNVVGQSFSGWSDEFNTDSPVYNLTRIDNCSQSNILSDEISELWTTILAWFLASLTVELEIELQKH